MMTVKETIGHYGKTILAGLVVFLVLIAGYRSCQIQTLRDEYNRLKGQYDTLKASADKALAEALVYIKTQDMRIADQNEIITAKDTDIAKQNEHIVHLNQTLSSLELEYATLTDCPSQVTNLKAQVLQWRNKYLAFESVLADKNAQLGAWRVKFDAQVGISETWKKRYEDEHALRLVADQALAVQEKRVKSLQFGSSLKTWIIGGAAAYLGYSLIRGTK